MRSRCRYCGIIWLAKPCNVCRPDLIRHLILQSTCPGQGASSERSEPTEGNNAPEGAREPDEVPVPWTPEDAADGRPEAAPQPRKKATRAKRCQKDYRDATDNP